MGIRPFIKVLQEPHGELTLSESVNQKVPLPLPVASQGCSILQVANWQTPTHDIDIARLMSSETACGNENVVIQSVVDIYSLLCFSLSSTIKAKINVHPPSTL